MRLVFWISLGGVFYTYIGYPALLWILTRLRPRPWRSEEISPSVSIVLAVHNGVALLEHRVRQLLEIDYGNVAEVIVVSDGSTDGTVERLSALEHPRLRKVILDSHSGKAVAVNAGMAGATADLILFVDLRPEIAPGAIRQLVSNFADDSVGCVAGEYMLRRDISSDDSAAVGRFYWAYEQWLRKCESLIDSPVGVPGCFYAVRRQLATMQPPGLILDDMFQPLAVVRQGYRCVFDSKACVYDTWPKKVAGEFRRKVRTLAGNFQLFQAAPWILSPGNRVFFQIFSHKVMRLTVPYLLLLCLLSSALLVRHSRFFLVIALLQAVGWTLAIVGSFQMPVLRRVAGPLNAVLVLNAAAVVGLYKFLSVRGPLWQIWNTGKAADSSSSPATGA